MTGEEFYRMKYPKVKKLTYMDEEIISLLDGYKEKFTSDNKQSTPYQTTCSHYRRIYGDNFCSQCGMRLS